MEEIRNYCAECEKIQPFEIINMEEGEDCWKILTVKCMECGNIGTVKVYA